MPPTDKTFNWLQIRDCLQGKPVAGLVMSNLAYWNIHPEKGRDELIDKGLPLAYVAYLCKQNRQVLEKQHYVNSDQKQNELIRILNTGDKTERSSDADKWLKRDFSLTYEEQESI